MSDNDVKYFPKVFVCDYPNPKGNKLTEASSFSGERLSWRGYSFSRNSFCKWIPECPLQSRANKNHARNKLRRRNNGKSSQSSVTKKLVRP